MRFITVLLLSVVVLSCDDDAPILDADIFYGTSFGECSGYCITETRINDRAIQVIAKKWFNNDKDQQVANGQLTDEQHSSILSGIDAEKFADLPETIGCPDCADGGAEWLELKVDGELKRVTFEYRDSINGIDEAVKILRNLTEDLHPVYDY
ncbi:MAG: hypothetical protein RIC35_05700 [Marinoscillum sp.]